MGTKILLSLLIACSAFAQGQFTFNGAGIAAASQTVVSGGGGGSCATLYKDQYGARDSGNNFGYYFYLGSTFTTVGGGTVCRTLVQLEGSATGTLQASIYTKSGSSPGTLIGTASALVNASTIPAIVDFVEFTGMSATLSATTEYFFILHASDNILTDFTKHNSSEIIRGSPDGSSWDSIGSASFNYQLFTE